MCQRETFEGCEKFLEEVRKKGPEVGMKMVYERKKERNKQEIFERSSRLDSWYNYESVESIGYDCSNRESGCVS
jgi:hypothetical protein